MDLNTAGAIDLVLPDGKRLRSHPLGIWLTDANTGGSELIARVKDCLGKIVLPNQVWYRDAFEGLAADVRCVVGKGVFEADVVLRESPLLPARFDPETTRLEVLTEFLDPPEPVVTTVPPDPGTGLVDQELDFGSMVMTPGKISVLPAEEAHKDVGGQGLRVSKRWLADGNRTLLVESVDLSALRPLLASLPARKVGAGGLAGFRGLPSTPDPNRNPAPLQLASASPVASGVVIDWQTVVSRSAPYTFQSGETYFVGGYVTLSGPVTIQSQAYVKFTNTAVLYLRNSVSTPATDQPRAVLTSADDNSVGEALGNGQPTTRAFDAINLYDAVGGDLETARDSLRGSGDNGL